MPIENSGMKGNVQNGSSLSKPVPHKIGSHKGYAAPNYNNSLSEGMVIRGEITDLRNREVTITLPDNTTIIAHTNDSSSLYIGQTTVFRVTGVTPQTITIERLSSKYSDGQAATILKALEEADLQKNERNMQIVRELLENRMPINKMMLQQIIQQASSFKGISTETLVLMNKHNMPVSQNTVTQFENLRMGNSSLIQTIDTISEELPTLLGTLSRGAPAELVKQFGSNLLNIINTHINNSPSPEYSTDLSFLDDSEKALLADAVGRSNPDIAAEILNGTATVSDLRPFIPGQESSAGQENILTAGQAGELPDGAAAGNAAETQGGADAAGRPDFPGKPDIPAILNKLSTADSYLIYKNQEIRSVMDAPIREKFTTDLRGLGMPESLIKNIREGTARIEDVFSAISRTISSLPASSSEKVASLFSSDGFSILFKNSIKNLWTMSPEDISKGPDSISEHYGNLLRDLSETTGLIQENLSGQGSESLSGQTTSMQDSLNFMEQLNALFSYVQLPVKFQDQTIHSDLYVYTKKEELKRHPEKVSVLLHLDMEHLGKLDIHIEKNNNQINSVFYCSDDDNAALFRKNIQMLTDTLNEQGYLFNASISNKKKNTDVVKEFIEANGAERTAESESAVKRYKFDIRA